MFTREWRPPQKPGEGVKSPGAGVTRSSEPAYCGCGELNLGPPEGLYVLLTSEPSLRSPNHLSNKAHMEVQKSKQVSCDLNSENPNLFSFKCFLEEF